MISRSLVAALSVALAAVVFVAGCSSLPTSPTSAGGASSAVLGFEPPVADPVDDSAPAPAQAVSASVYVRAVKGGTVRAGDFTVIVPPLALKGDAIITVRQPDVTRPEVELSITPEERNTFLLPVLLVADAQPMDAALVSTSYISWWNPGAARWERCSASTVNLATISVQAPLWHFSKYRVEADGKAGW